jgi:integrase
VWDPEEVTRFLTQAADGRFFGLFLLAATTGMRRAELCGLRRPAVSLDGSKLLVATSRVVVRGHAQDSDETKSERSTRSISLDPITVDALRKRQKDQDEERTEFGGSFRSTDLVFTCEDGRPPHPDVVRQRFQRLAAHLRLKVIRLHDLRHTYATIALAAGVKPKVVSERLGHASVAFMLQLYSHVLPSVDEEAAKRVADLMLGREPFSNPFPKSPRT